MTPPLHRPTHRFAFLTYLVLGLLLYIPTLSAQVPTAIEALIRDHLPKGSEVGIYAYDLHTNRPLIDHRSQALARPASTLKLVTAIGYLQHRTSSTKAESSAPFTVSLRADGTVSGDTLHGDLYVKGGFHPLFAAEELEHWAQTLVNHPTRPIRVVTGGLYADLSCKDTLHWGSGWAWDDEPEPFQPHLSALMLNQGTVTVRVTPSAVAGMPATVEVSPRSTAYAVSNRTQSMAPQAGELRIGRNEHNVIHLMGNASRPVTRSLSLHDRHGHFFMTTLADCLTEAGLRIGQQRYALRICADSLPALCTSQAELDEVLHEALGESNNLCAEYLLLELGRGGEKQNAIGATDGIEMLRAFLKQLGYGSQDYRIADGSGLSPYNYLSPALLVKVLRWAHGKPEVYRHLSEALPLSGVSGTLKNRMKQGPAHKHVWAKTGTMTGISSLAGYVRAANGHLIAFAVMNQNVLSASKARDFQDRVCQWLARQ